MRKPSTILFLTIIFISGIIIASTYNVHAQVFPRNISVNLSAIKDNPSIESNSSPSQNPLLSKETTSTSKKT